MAQEFTRTRPTAQAKEHLELSLEVLAETTLTFLHDFMAGKAGIDILDGAGQPLYQIRLRPMPHAPAD